MELLELVEHVRDMFEAGNKEELKDKIYISVCENEVDKYAKFKELVNDLSVDWMQMIFQYYYADRKELMQDYTPKSLGELIGQLVGEPEEIIDMCAGSGALTIQKWASGFTGKFILYEFDENVIPFLLFNMIVRNIKCDVHHSDVLSGEVFKSYHIEQGEKFGILRS